MESLQAQPVRATCTRRLVIVADNSLIVEAIRIAFRKSGEFHLVGHADGRRTSAHTIAGAQPDLVLLDDMDRSDRAIELLRAIRCADAEIAVIALTVDMTSDWLELLFEAGAKAVISKATHPVALATLVRETLNDHVFHRVVARHGAVRSTPAGSSVDDLHLTAREREILQLVADGSTNGEIARRLWVTEQTVKFHLRNLYRKIDVTNRTQAGRFAHVNGLARFEVGEQVRPEAAEVRATAQPNLTAV